MFTGVIPSFSVSTYQDGKRLQTASLFDPSFCVSIVTVVKGFLVTNVFHGHILAHPETKIKRVLKNFYKNISLSRACVSICNIKVRTYKNIAGIAFPKKPQTHRAAGLLFSDQYLRFRAASAFFLRFTLGFS